jgi:hypothetical protein
MLFHWLLVLLRRSVSEMAAVKLALRASFTAAISDTLP